MHAPIERCFDAARDLDLHLRSLAHTNERAVAGRTSGLIELGEEVTWRARHFGITQHFTSKITAFDRPRYFQDAMQRGAFRSFVHDHFFTVDGDKLRCPELDRYRAHLDEESRKKSEGGKAGAAKTNAARNTSTAANPTAIPQVSCGSLVKPSPAQSSPDKSLEGERIGDPWLNDYERASRGH